MVALPTGTVTFLFADIERSTSLLESLGDRYAEVLKEYRRLLRTAASDGGGQEVDTQGDACFIAFDEAIGLAINRILRDSDFRIRAAAEAHRLQGQDPSALACQFIEQL